MMATEEDNFPLEVDVASLNLDPPAFRFFAELTGIHDEGELRKHIISVASEALQVFHYPCIRRFRFTQFVIRRAPWYQEVIDLGIARPNAILLDVGCGFGDDMRKLVVDGYPAANMIGTDLRAPFWELGHKLFRSNSETFPAHFIEGDILDPSFLPLAPIDVDAGNSLPALRTLQDLSALSQQISIIHTAQVIHMMPLEQQVQAAHRLGSLLSPAAGSLIFGRHYTTNIDTVVPLQTSRGSFNMACHSPSSWVSLWDGGVFPQGTVEVRTVFEAQSDEDLSLSLGGKELAAPLGNLFWCVKRL